MSDPASKPDVRWWEGYAVRYLVPTMTGMVFLRWLQLSASEVFSPFFPPAGKVAGALSDFHSVTMVELLLWAGGGFAFAYIASLPILVFHATRSLEVNQRKRLRLSSPLRATLLMVAATILTAVVKQSVPVLESWIPAATLGIVIMFSGAQLFRIRLAGGTRFQAAKYARAVAMARVADVKWHGDYVTSYRHLREHGNAAFIVLLQAALCALLYLCLTTSTHIREDWMPKHWAASSICLLLLVIWLVPSVAVHALSQRLEAYIRPKPWPALPTERVAQVVPQPTDAGASSQKAASTIGNSHKIKFWLRMLKAASQLSPWLLPLAFCPPILLLWIHLTDLHYPALLMTAIGSTAGLGALLLLGSLIWVMWIMSLALPSMLIALVATLYDPGKPPRKLVCAWTGLGLGAIAYCFASVKCPTLVETIGFFQAFGVLAALPALTVACRAPDSVKSSGNGQGQCWKRLLLGLLVFLVAFFVLCLVLLPLYMVSRAYGKEPDSIALIAGVIAFSFFSALAPGLLYLWLNSNSNQAASGMSVSTFAVILLAPPVLSVIFLTAVKMQLSYLTLASSGIVDRGGTASRPGLYRLPEDWSEHDRQLTASFPALSDCVEPSASQPKSVGWICGYRNFSFASTQLVCDKPYANENGRFSEASLTCIAYVGNQIVNLVHLPKPGPTR